MNGTNWGRVKIGGGGFVVGIDIANDGTKVVRADVYGAYVRSPSDTSWRQLLTTAAMPPGTIVYTQGPFDLAISKSNSNVIYTLWQGYLYKTSDQGATWTKLTAFNGGTQIPTLSSDGNRYGSGIGFAARMNGRFIAVDPFDPNVVYVTTPETGCFYTFDGGSTFTKIAAISQSATINTDPFNPYMPCLVAIDAGASPVNGRSPNVYIASYGFKLYKTTNGGAPTPTWSQESGGPTTFTHMAVDKDGTLYVVDNTQYNGQTVGSLWTRTTGGTWTDLALTSIHAVAPDPTTAGRVVLSTDSGHLYLSTTHGASTTDLGTGAQSAPDVPWLALTVNSYFATGDIALDPSGLLWVTEGIGVYYTTPAASFTWVSQTAGIEELVTNFIKSTPASAYPLIGCWDRPLFKITDPQTYPATQLPNNKRFIQAGWNADYASSSPSYVAAIVDWDKGAYLEDSGYSTDGGATWTPFGTSPFYSILTTSAPSSSGSSVLTFASVPTNLISAKPGGNGRRPQYLGTKAVTTGSTVAPSRVLHFAGTLSANVAPGMVAVSDHLTGTSVVTVNYLGVTGDVLLDGPPTSTVPSGDTIYFRNGATVTNVNFAISAVSGTTITLGSALLANVLAGEDFVFPGAIAGSIAVSTPLNMVWVPMDNSPYPWYTKDGGATWKNIVIGTSITGFDSGGAAIPDAGDGNVTGWGAHYYDGRISCCADRVQSGWMWVYNHRQLSAGGGLYFTSDGGDTWTQKFAGRIAGDNGGFGAKIMSVPGNQGHLFMSGCNADFGNNGISRSTDSGATWTALANVSKVQSIAIGAPKPGGAGYPAIYFVGQLSGVPGVWRSDNMPTSGAGSETWTQIGDICPIGWLNGVNTLEADASVYGRIFAGMAQSGAIYGLIGASIPHAGRSWIGRF